MVRLCCLIRYISIIRLDTDVWLKLMFGKNDILIVVRYWYLDGFLYLVIYTFDIWLYIYTLIFDHILSYTIIWSDTYLIFWTDITIQPKADGREAEFSFCPRVFVVMSMSATLQYSVQFTVYCVQCTVYSVRCTVYSLHHTAFSL